MKTFRVTLKYITNGHTGYISTVIPAFHNTEAIDKVTTANNLAGRVTASNAVELTNY